MGPDDRGAKAGRATPKADFQAPGGNCMPVFAQTAVYFVFPGADVKVCKKNWALPFLAMSGYAPYYNRVKGHTLPS